MDRGTFDKQGLDLELRQFNTGLEIFQALIGGSLDVLATGAVLSNFPARGQGKVFLINDIEVATAQLWVRSDQGIKSFEDLKGKRIATTTGTTAHVFLDKALRANKIDPKEVELVNQTMPAAVTAFISGAVPAVALWVPFNVTVRDKVPGAVKLADASAYYPQAAIIGGWAASNDYYDANKETLAKLIRGWAEANDYIIANSERSDGRAAEGSLQPDPADGYQGVLPGAEDVHVPATGSGCTRTGQSPTGCSRSTDFFMANAGIKDFTPASKYFDPSLYLKTIG